MIVRSPLDVQADPQGGWQLIFWVGQAFDHATPFRTMLSDIAGALGQTAKRDLQLPPYEAGEDFIDGTLKFGKLQLRIYYEHSLSYLALMSDYERALRDAAKRVEPYVVVTTQSADR